MKRLNPLTYGIPEPCETCSHRRENHPGDGPCMTAVAGGQSICPCAQYSPEAPA